eukprot:4770054-Pleurochrysis_carterae.AAC.3
MYLEWRVRRARWVLGGAVGLILVVVGVKRRVRGQLLLGVVLFQLLLEVVLLLLLCLGAAAEEGVGGAAVLLASAGRTWLGAVPETAKQARAKCWRVSKGGRGGLKRGGRERRKRGGGSEGEVGGGREGAVGSRSRSDIVASNWESKDRAPLQLLRQPAKFVEGALVAAVVELRQGTDRRLASELASAPACDDWRECARARAERGRKRGTAARWRARVQVCERIGRVSLWVGWVDAGLCGRVRARSGGCAGVFGRGRGGGLIGGRMFEAHPRDGGLADLDGAQLLRFKRRTHA